MVYFLRNKNIDICEVEIFNNTEIKDSIIPIIKPYLYVKNFVRFILDKMQLNHDISLFVSDIDSLMGIKESDEFINILENHKFSKEEEYYDYIKNKMKSIADKYNLRLIKN